MNLLLLVEGQQTEPRVYPTWLRRHLPGLQQVANVAGLTSDGYVLVRGNGYPSCLRRIDGLLRDIEDHPGKVDHFWVCVDSEECSYAERHTQVQRALDEAAASLNVWKLNPQLQLRIIVQHCCIETWFLGHAGFLRAGPQSRRLVEFKRFHDVSLLDPEEMGCPEGYVTRASFHCEYLKEMLAERSHRYAKDKPGVVLEANYFAALRQRCQRTQHLRSFQRLLDGLDALAPSITSAGVLER